MRVEGPALQIVSGDLWQRAHAELVRRVAQYDRGGRAHRESRYLLAGLARCAVCGGGFAGQTRSHGGARVPFYGCTSYWKRGRAVCALSHHVEPLGFLEHPRSGSAVSSVPPSPSQGDPCP